MKLLSKTDGLYNHDQIYRLELLQTYKHYYTGEKKVFVSLDNDVADICIIVK